MKDIKDIEREFDEKFLRPDKKWKLSANGRFNYSPEEIKSFYRTALQTLVDEAREEALSNKVVLYVQPLYDHSNLSHEDRLKLEADEFMIYLGDTAKGVWGDDWNDAPDDCNSGVPYEDSVKGLVKLKVTLGKSLSPNQSEVKE